MTLSRLSQAVRRLALPASLARRVDRALDRGLRNRHAGERMLRHTMTEAAAVLLVRLGEPRAVVAEMRELVIAHAGERGERSLSVFAGLPAHEVFAAEIAGWVAVYLGIVEPPGDAPTPHGRVGRWVWQARRLQGGGSR